MNGLIDLSTMLSGKLQKAFTRAGHANAQND
jgi:hypothetical protein